MGFLLLKIVIFFGLGFWGYPKVSLYITVIDLIDYGKKYKISHSNLINKAKRQTIEAFSEKGKWKIADY